MPRCCGAPDVGTARLRHGRLVPVAASALGSWRPARWGWLWPRRGRPVPAGLGELAGPDFGSADEWVRTRDWNALVQQVEDDRADVLERGPPSVRPAPIRADRGQMVLREHEIGVACGVEVAEAVAEEDRVIPGSLMGEDSLALAGAAHPARRVTVWEIDRDGTGREGCTRRVHREVAEPDPLQRPPHEEAEAVAHDLDDRAARQQLVDKGPEGRIQVFAPGHRGDLAGVAVEDRRLAGQQGPGPDIAGEVGRLERCPRLEIGMAAHHLVAEVEAGDGPVEVDKHKQPRRPAGSGARPRPGEG